MTLKYIYGLIDPRDGQLRYVGKTSRALRTRLNHHVHMAVSRKLNTHNAAWIRSLAALGLRPEIVELDSAELSVELSEAEQFWIQYYRFIGCRLVNHTEGGEGCEGYRHTDEAKAKMSELKRGKTSPRRGVVLSAETRARISASKTGKRTNRAVPVVDQYGNVYRTQYEAAEAIKVSRSLIYMVLTGKRRAAKGYVFKFVE